jgi:hypothetical protein
MWTRVNIRHCAAVACRGKVGPCNSLRIGAIYANIRQSERGVAARFISNSAHFEKRKRQSTNAAPTNNPAL